MSKWLAAVIFAILLFLSAGSAQAQHQHSKPQSHQQTHQQTHQNHGPHYENRSVQHGHGRNEGRVIDEGYRGRYFGRENHAFCGAFYGRPTFLFGGIWFGIGAWPSYWLSTDYVYVEYVDGDYFLVNERLIGAEEYRVAIVIE
jgi:preprotein translocase subunit SecG